MVSASFLSSFLLICGVSVVAAQLPVVTNTWPFTGATAASWSAVQSGGTALDAVVAGLSSCEVTQCDGTVGYGGSPDSDGDTTLDALVMDGDVMDVGAVGCLQSVREAAAVALAVMKHTTHTMLAGTKATEFATQMGFEFRSLNTPHSQQMFANWTLADCQPNYMVDVDPPGNVSCGPYSPASARRPRDPADRTNPNVKRGSHDTISMLVVLPPSGKGSGQPSIAAGTSTNGANHKVAGRVGDGAIVGAGSYADSRYGACGETGDGDTMMRFLPCARALFLLEAGWNVNDAADEAIARILPYYPTFIGAILVVDAAGNIGAAGHGWIFTYSYQRAGMSGVQTVEVPPLNASRVEELLSVPLRDRIVGAQQQ